MDAHSTDGYRAPIAADGDYRQMQARGASAEPKKRAWDRI
jgi:hypothetical protein